jgi:hypothetical protein
MAGTVRAKFRCVAVTRTSYSPAEEDKLPRQFVFQAIYDETIPEDRRYAKYSPSGELKILVDNPAVNWEIGKSYYLDFTPVEEGA